MKERGTEGGRERGEGKKREGPREEDTGTEGGEKEKKGGRK